jgi:alkanesulfonate monooxygenase SsuD/methylene tetrahydromethanopterin reductase-like flavin-dependent oxidoreductase (luciferase family)
MRFGTSNMFYWKAGMTQSEVIKNGIERLVWAEEMGFDSAWLTEHHFGNDPNYHPFGMDGSEHLAYDLSADPLTILSHVAAKTKRIRLGTGVVVLHFDNPLRTAERAALVDIVSDGRLELGVGRGGGHRQPATFGVPKDSKANRDKFGEAVDILQLAWTGKPFTYHGQFYDVPQDVIVTPKPVQDPFPLYVAGSSPDSFAWVGSRGLPFCYAGGAWGKSGWDKYTEHLRAYFDAAKQAGVDTSKFHYPQIVHAYCADTDAQAEEVARNYIVEHRRYGEGHYENRRYATQATGAPDLPSDVSQTFKALADDVIEGDIIGSPESCIRKLRAYCDFFKPNYLLLSVGFGLIPQDLVLRSMERISRYVLPAFADERELVTA